MAQRSAQSPGRLGIAVVVGLEPERLPLQLYRSEGLVVAPVVLAALRLWAERRLSVERRFSLSAARQLSAQV